MKTPAEFDEIRPYDPEDLQGIYDELMEDESFLAVVQAIMPAALSRGKEGLRAMLGHCTTNLDFQRTFIYPMIEKIVSEKSTSTTLDATALTDRKQPYVYISNHRDIVLDSALLCMLLIRNGFKDTVEIAIGDNLLAYPWIKKIVRINKAFIVQRSLSMREMLASSKRMSEYMQYALTQKRQSIWIAQREGRAKDSDDRTQEALIKMMLMGGEGDILEKLKRLHIVPLSISYEYDPCDFLKAQEFQMKRDVEGFKKSKQDDLINMQTGIYGFKGQIHYHMAPCINPWLDTLEGLPKAEILAQVVQHIDHEIHANYRIFANNYIALDMLEHTDHSDHYTPEQRLHFEKYLQERLQMIRVPQGRDDDFLMERMLTMYANPLRNHLKATES